MIIEASQVAVSPEDMHIGDSKKLKQLESSDYENDDDGQYEEVGFEEYDDDENVIAPA